MESNEGDEANISTLNNTQSPPLGHPAIDDTIRQSLQDAADELLSSLGYGGEKENGDQMLTESRLIVMFDEAHSLMNGRAPSAFVDLRRTIRSLRHLPILFVFLSTTGSVTQFSPSQHDDPSNRAVRGHLKIMNPFTELEFDVMADKTAAGTITLATATSTDFMVKFGRPLYVPELLISH
jgi:hypothetical protein